MKKFIFYFALLVVLLTNKAVAMSQDITVYYFHSKTRCSTCRNIEKMTREAVLAVSDVSFEPVNTDEPENKHYLSDYGLYTKSVVLVDNTGRWKNLDLIWTFVRSEPEFKSYIITEINNFKDKK